MKRMDQVSGLDSLEVRRAYFHKLRSHHFESRRIAATWGVVGAVVGWLSLSGFMELGH